MLVRRPSRSSASHPGKPGVLLGKSEQERENRPAAGRGVGDVIQNAGNACENALFDEVDQSLKHARLAGEVAIQRRFGNAHLARQCGRGDPLATVLFQHDG